MAGTSELHAESLLRIPLVMRALTDENVRTTARAIDCNWRYHEFVSRSLVGFNPFIGRVYYGGVSAFSRWFDHRAKSARRFNEQDRLIKEVLFAVHDYLHVWAYSALAEMCPQFRPGEVRLDEGNLETFAFLHTVTEACATVGLDYWYLSTVNLNDVCDLGTTLSTLTVGYHDRFLSEYRRFCPSLDVQQPSFLRSVVEFYCTGDFMGFSVRDLLESPRVMAWIRHELEYGELQRKYIRRWLHYLAGKRSPTDDVARRAIACNASWQRSLVEQLGERLWAFVKDGVADPVRHVGLIEGAWRAPKRVRTDFAFVNLSALDDAAVHRLAAKATSPQSFDWLFDQYLSRFVFEGFDPEKRRRLRKVRLRRDWKALRALCNGEARVPVGADEYLEIMLQN